MLVIPKKWSVERHYLPPFFKFSLILLPVSKEVSILYIRHYLCSYLYFSRTQTRCFAKFFVDFELICVVVNFYCVALEAHHEIFLCFHQLYHGMINTILLEVNIL